MEKHNDKKMSRKDFLRKTSAGLLTFGLFKGNPFKYANLTTAQKQASPENRKLGRTGIRVRPVGYGTSRTMEPTLVKSVIDRGINFLDTGRSYYNGQNEVMIGKVIQGIRKELIIQSKISLRLREKGDSLNSTAVSRRITNMMQSSLTESLKALQTDYIDILLIHGAESVDIINHEAIIDFFRSAKEKGQIRACGFSSHSNQIELLNAANENRLYDVIMIPYNHKGSYRHSRSGSYSEWDQPALEVELEKAEKNNIGIVAMKTCSGGPYSPSSESKPSYKAALEWILDHSYIATTATAMGNMNELNEDVKAMV